ncbi:AAA family ATPase [Nocardia colli]|uniref:AAA family ATPase n=1 Tax=Nocardia colli TaxID=2545717 RepID=UPI0035D8AC27
MVDRPVYRPSVLSATAQAELDHVAERLTRPAVVVICGFPGSGKTTAATYLATCCGAVVLDKDRFAPRLERDVLRALGSDPFDRDGELYRTVLSPGIYDALIRVGLSIGSRYPTVLDAPFLSVIRDAAESGSVLAPYLRRRAQMPDSLMVHTVWIDVPAAELAERMILRGAERDVSKLGDWAAYRSAVLDGGLREIAHGVVDVVIGN